MNGITRIKSEYDSYSKIERKIANIILNDRDFVIKSTIHELAEYLGVSAGSISRFVRTRMDCTFQELKIELASINLDSESNQRNTEMIEWANSLTDMSTNIINAINEICLDVIDVNQVSTFEKAIKLIKEAETVFFFGIGASGIIVNDFLQKLMRLEKRCVYNTDSNFGILNSKIATKKDVIVAISFSGQTREVIFALQEARKTGVPVISITKSGKNAVEQLADVKFFVPSTEYNATRISPIFSRYGQFFIVDMIFLGIAKESTKSVEDFVDQYRSLLDKLKEKD